MSNPYYDFAPSFIPGTKVRSDAMNLQLTAIENAFDLLPGNADAITTGTATFAPETGSGNAYVVTMPTTRTSNQDGDEIVFFATHTNTATPTLNVDGIGAVTIVRADGGVIAAGDMNDGLGYAIRYDAANVRFQIMSALVSDTGLGVSQTPWTSNINAAGFDLTGLNSVTLTDQGYAVLLGYEAIQGMYAFSNLSYGFAFVDAGDVINVDSDGLVSSPPVEADAPYANWVLASQDGTWLSSFGFTDTSTFEIGNYIRGGMVNLFARNTSFVERVYMNFDPDTELLSLGPYVLDESATVGAGQDNYVLTYDNGTGSIGLEVIPAGGGEVNDLTAAVTWANIPIANVPTGTTGSTVALGNHAHLLAAGATDVTALAAEVNLLDLAGLTAGWVLSADTATTASWKAPVVGGEVNDLSVAVTWANIPIANVPTGTTGSTVALGNHTQVLASGATDVTATAAEVNMLDLSGLTSGWVLSADSATTASWKAPTGGSQTPWSSDIDGGGFGLDNIDRLEIQAPGIPGDSMTATHDGTDFSYLYANTASVDSTGATSYTFDNDVHSLNGGEVRAYEVGSTDYAYLRHDNTNGILSANNGNVIFETATGWETTTGVISSNAVTLNYEDGNAFEVDLAPATGNVTITLGGQEPPFGNYGIMEVKVEQDATARTITWAGGTFIWTNGIEHVMNPTINTGISIFVFETWNNGTTWYASGVSYG